MSKQTSPFLALVAEDLITRFGNDLSRVTVVFPGRRARLFFDNYLCECSNEPVWAPQYLAIDDLFRQASGLQMADDIKLICELYDSYISIYNKYAVMPSTETLDEFYFFGEILLNDFDDVDKNLVDAHSLFGNLQDLDQLRDDFSHLSESQTTALMRYFQFKHAFHGNTPLKTAFWSIWNILGEVYDTFKARLLQLGIAYPGMLMRAVIENELKIDLSQTAVFSNEHYVFVGFNVLNKCEEQLFRRLKDKALFYWDFDNYYFDTKRESFNEAGRFVRDNIEKFGSALPLDKFDNFLSHKPEITIIASASESGQSAYINPWLEQLNRPAASEVPDSAIILCNEQILPTVMHSISPQKAENVNITMGFPLTQSPICSFLQVLAEMQVKGANESGKSFRYKYVLPVLRHPYARIIFPEAESVEKTLLEGNIFFPTLEVLQNKDLFAYATSSLDLAKYLLSLVELAGRSYEKETVSEGVYSGLYKESIFRAYQIINRLIGLITSEETAFGISQLHLNKATFLRLMRKLFASTKIPFHGEPVRGLQVMGVLETRVLDFKNLLFLSVNEGFMPSASNDNTFIPQFLRKHFDLNTIEHQDSIYAYYFYRLIQRAEHITFIYNTDKRQTGKAEMSRFLLQLLIDSQLDIKRYSMQSAIKPWQPQPIEVEKTPALLETTRNRFDISTNPNAQRLSPSALNILIDCSLRFYLQYIEGLRVNDELSDELDVAVFGNIFHRAAELLYREIGNIGDVKEFSPFVVRKQHFDVYIENPHLIERLIVQAFSEKYFKNKEVTVKDYNGEQLIKFRVIYQMMRRLIEFDSKQTPFYICGLEENRFYADFELPEANAVLRIGGIIDRLEEKDDAIKVLDYKTGGSAKAFKEMSDLVTQKDTRASHIFQAFTYSSVLIKNNIGKPVIPLLLYMQDAGKEDYSAVIQYEKEDITDFTLLSPLFEDVLTRKLSELFDQHISFCQTTALAKCSYCDFKELCNR